MDNFTNKSSFGQWISPINFEKVDHFVKISGIDRYTKKLNTSCFIKLLLFSQLCESESLRAMSDSLFSEDLQEAIKLETISFSQLGRKLSKVTTDVFQLIFNDLVNQIHRHHNYEHQRKTSTPLKIIDSSTLPLSLNKHQWAEFRSTKSGVKLHMRLMYMPDDKDAYPDQFYLTNACESDQNNLDILIDDKACTYVFDRGYMNYERFDRMTDDGYHFVSKLRKNAVYRVIENFDITQSNHVISDQMVYIGTTQSRSENPYRLLKVTDRFGKAFLIITNRFDLTPDEVADIYKSRWSIELFFKWVKQHMNIKKFYGHSQTAVTNQVYIAMIVYCLNVLIKLKTNSKKKLLQIARLLKVKIWEEPKYWIRRISDTIP